MKQQHKILLLITTSFLAGIAIFYLFGHYVGWDNFKGTGKDFNIYYILTIVLITFAIAIAGTYRLKEIISTSNSKISFHEVFKIYLGSYSIMYLFPIAIFSGEFLKIYAIHRKNIRWDKAIAFVVIERVIELTFTFLTIILGLLIFTITFNILPSSILSIFGIIIISIFTFLFLFYFNATRRNGIASQIMVKIFKKKVINSNSIVKVEKCIYDYFHYQNKSFHRSIAWSIVKVFLMQLRFIVLIIFLTGTIIPFFNTFPILGFSQLAVMIPVPAGIGTYEFAQLFVFKRIGLDNSVAISLSMIIRISEVIVCSFGVLYLLRAGFKFVGNKLNVFELINNKKYEN